VAGLQSNVDGLAAAVGARSGRSAVTGKGNCGWCALVALAGTAEAQVMVPGTSSQTEQCPAGPDVVRRSVEGFERNLRGAIESAAAQLNKRLIEAVPNAQFQLQFQAVPTRQRRS
jgi:hypothetical protein